MRPDQLDLLVSVSAPSVHPSEPWCVVATSRPDFGADSYTGQLWRVPFDGSPRRLTRGFHDRAPQFSPDGTLLAFIRRAQDGKPQLYVVEATGGEPVQLTDQHLGVQSYAWAPDGRSLVYVARVAAEGRYGTLDGVSGGLEDPRRFEGVQLQSNGMGWYKDRPAQLFVVELPDLDAEPKIKPVGRAAKAQDDQKSKASEESQGSEEPKEGGETKGGKDNPLVPTSRRIIEDGVDYASPVFSADGAAIFALAARQENSDRELADDIWRIPLNDGEPTQINASRVERLGFHSLHRSADGSSLLALGNELGESGADFVGRNPGVYVIPAAGGDAERRTDLRHHVASVEPRDDGGFVFLADERGRTLVYAMSAAGEESQLLGGDIVATGVAPVPGGSDVVVSRSAGDSTGDVVLVREGSEQRLTDFSAPLREETSVVAPRELTVDAPDGYPVHGWIFTPEGDGPFPTLLVIHGGPFAAYTPAYFDEVQTYVAAGYAVVLCNPRGSAGYGEEHGQAIKGDFGNLDFRDIIAFLEGALEQEPTLDRERLGVMGGSYGGYMTAWIIAHDHRFKGAIVERGFLDPASFIGASDIGWFFSQAYNGEDLERMNAQSPLLLTGDVTTPTLVLHSEQDLRCPLSQALRYYTQLKLAGVESELLVFPGENHELSRSGSPWHRRQRFEAILDWWQRHLG